MSGPGPGRPGPLPGVGALLAAALGVAMLANVHFHERLACTTTHAELPDILLLASMVIGFPLLVWLLRAAKLRERRLLATVILVVPVLYAVTTLPHLLRLLSATTLHQQLVCGDEAVPGTSVDLLERTFGPFYVLLGAFFLWRIGRLWAKSAPS